MHVGREHAVAGVAAGVQINRDIRHGQDDAVDEMRQHLRKSACRVTGKGAVEIAVVDRRQTRVVQKGRHIDSRHNDEPAAHILDAQSADQPRQGDRPLIFVAVDAARQQQRRPRSIGVNDNRNFHRSPAARVARQRRAGVARLAALPAEINCAADAACGFARRHKPSTIASSSDVCIQSTLCQAVARREKAQQDGDADEFGCDAD